MSPIELSVLHSLRCVGFGGAGRFVPFTGLDERSVREGLEELRTEGLARHETGPFGGWSITDLGRARHAEWMAAETSEPDVRGAVGQAHDRFVELNPRFLRVCRDWQLRDVGGTPVMNDHTDPDHDMSVLDRLARVDRSIHAVLVPLARAVPRFLTPTRGDSPTQ